MVELYKGRPTYFIDRAVRLLTMQPCLFLPRSLHRVPPDGSPRHTGVSSLQPGKAALPGRQPRWRSYAALIGRLFMPTSGARDTMRQRRRTLPRISSRGCCAFFPDGKRIVTGRFDGTVRIWDIASRLEIQPLKRHTAEVFSVAVSPDSRWIATSGWDHSIRVWDAVTGPQRH